MANPYRNLLKELNAEEYQYNELAQQDPYVDSKSTMGSRLVTGNRYIDMMNQQLQDQALQDNSLNFIPGSNLGSIARGTTIAAKGASKAQQISAYTGLPIGEAFKDSFNKLGYFHQKYFVIENFRLPASLKSYNLYGSKNSLIRTPQEVKGKIRSLRRLGYAR